EFVGENRAYGALITFSVNAPNLPLADEEKERQRKEAERAKAHTEAGAPGQPATDRPTGTPREDQPSREEAAAEEPPSGGRGRNPQARAEMRGTEPPGKARRTLPG